MTTASSIRRTLAVCAVVLFAAGCGGGDKASPGSSSTAKTAPASPDQRRAQTALVKQSDFPSGWAQLRGSGADTLNSRCPEVAGARNLAIARASEPNFAKPPNAVVQSLVFVYKDVASAKKALHELGSASLRNCVADELEARAKTVKGVTPGDLLASRLLVPAVGDKRTAFAIELEVTSGPTQSVVHEQVAFVRADRAIAIVAFAQQDSDVPATLRDSLVRVSGQRLVKAFSAG